MDSTAFAADIERRPTSLQDLQRVLVTDDPWHQVPDDVGQVLFLGMGSSTFAASVAAARLRALGVDAVAELASSELLPPPDTEQLVVAISASGGSQETLDAVAQYAGQSTVIALTNVEDSSISQVADATILMHAGPERGGVSCRSYTHTQVLLLALEERMSGIDRDLLAIVGRSIEATQDLLDRRAAWLPDLVDHLDGGDITAVAAPFRRLGNAAQTALMLRSPAGRPSRPRRGSGVMSMCISRRLTTTECCFCPAASTSRSCSSGPAIAAARWFPSATMLRVRHTRCAIATTKTKT